MAWTCLIWGKKKPPGLSRTVSFHRRKRNLLFLNPCATRNHASSTLSVISPLSTKNLFAINPWSHNAHPNTRLRCEQLPSPWAMVHFVQRLSPPPAFPPRTSGLRTRGGAWRYFQDRIRHFQTTCPPTRDIVRTRRKSR